jgi:hypothetical protein
MTAKKVLPTTKLAYVRWFDSAIYKGEACQPEDLTGTCENESAGVLVKEDDKEITIALDRCLDTKDVRLVLCVPKANVRSIQHFTVLVTSSAASSSESAPGRKRQPS